MVQQSTVSETTIASSLLHTPIDPNRYGFHELRASVASRRRRRRPPSQLRCWRLHAVSVTVVHCPFVTWVAVLGSFGDALERGSRLCVTGVDEAERGRRTGTHQSVGGRRRRSRSRPAAAKQSVGGRQWCSKAWAAGGVDQLSTSFSKRRYHGMEQGKKKNGEELFDQRKIWQRLKLIRWLRVLRIRCLESSGCTNSSN